MDSPKGILVRRCFRLLNAKTMGITITFADITEEEFRLLELIEIERQEQMSVEPATPASARPAALATR
jgi:hypothetical protein